MGETPMIARGKPHARVRLTPLAAGLLLACTHAAGANEPLSAAMPQAWTAGTHAGVAALFAAVRNAHKPAPTHAPTTTAVTSCDDDGGTGTLRAVVAAAGNSDTIDLSALTCSTITLTQGAIPVQQDTLTLTGPGADHLAIDGAGVDRVFIHYGYETFRLNGLTVRNGVNKVRGYHIAGGACILANGYLTLDHSTVSGCTAVGEAAYGGGVLTYALAMYTSTLSGNVAQGSLLTTLTAAYGGGVFAYRGTVLMYDSMVSGNRATIDPANTHGSYDTGGGIFADYGGFAGRSTIAGNYTDGTGGGISSHSGFFISNSTISGNIAQNKRGGGIFARLDGPLNFYNSTVAHNQAIDGGGIYAFGTQPFTLQSTIVAKNLARGGSPDIATQSPLTITGANNLVMAVGAGVTLPDDTLTADPLLLPLADNGGPTPTHALALVSPARDTGNNIVNLATDQRGVGHPRVIGARADIGAFEARAVAQVAEHGVPSLSLPGIAALASLLGWLGLRRIRRAGSV
jgi:hypothetical protein